MGAATLLVPVQSQQAALAKFLRPDLAAKNNATPADGRAVPEAVSDTGGTQVLMPPEDWQVGRATDGPQRSDVLKVLDDLVAQLGERRASIYDLGDRFAVRVVEPTDLDAARVASAQASSPIEIELVAVAASAAWLQDMSIYLSNTMAKDGITTGVDLATGHVYAGTQQLDGGPSDVKLAITAEVDAAIARGQAIGEVSDAATTTDLLDLIGVTVKLAADVRANPYVKGGRWVDTFSSYCTAGFLVGNSSGVKRFTTAGHCFQANDTSVAMADGTYVGERTQWYPDGWDHANYSLPTAWQTQPVVTVQSDGDYRKVMQAGNPVDGEQLCFTGRGSVAVGYDEKCETQTRTVVYGGKTLYCIERQAEGGDSGGPVYRIASNGVDANARGTMVLNHTIPVPIFNDRQFACYNRIDDIATAGGWTVMLWK